MLRRFKRSVSEATSDLLILVNTKLPTKVPSFFNADPGTTKPVTTKDIYAAEAVSNSASRLVSTQPEAGGAAAPVLSAASSFFNHERKAFIPAPSTQPSTI